MGPHKGKQYLSRGGSSITKSIVKNKLINSDMLVKKLKRYERRVHKTNVPKAFISF